MHREVKSSGRVEKILKLPITFFLIKTYDLDRKKNLFNFKQIIQILQPIVIDYLSPHLYIVDFS